MAQIVYYKNLVNTEITRLSKLCDKWNDIFSEGDPSEEEQGNILAVIGQTNLLIKKKIKQFTNLIQQCEKNDSSQRVTLDDLQGFWDLVYIEIDNINSQFLKLELKLENKWRPIVEAPVENNNEVIKKRRKPPSTTVDTQAVKQRLIAAKSAMQERLKKQNSFC